MKPILLLILIALPFLSVSSQVIVDSDNFPNGGATAKEKLVKQGIKAFASAYAKDSVSVEVTSFFNQAVEFKVFLTPRDIRRFEGPSGKVIASLKNIVYSFSVQQGKDQTSKDKQFAYRKFKKYIINLYPKTTKKKK